MICENRKRQIDDVLYIFVAQLVIPHGIATIVCTQHILFLYVNVCIHLCVCVCVFVCVCVCVCVCVFQDHWDEGLHRDQRQERSSSSDRSSQGQNYRNQGRFATIKSASLVSSNRSDFIDHNDNLGGLKGTMYAKRA